MKGYEEDYDTPPINLSFFALVGLVLLVSGIIYYPYIIKFLHPEPLEYVNLSVINESKAIQIEYVTVIVTPVPDGKMYFASEYESGIRKLGRPFSWIAGNVTGFKSMSIHARVYDYRIFDKYHWFNPTDWLYYTEYPSSRDKKFVFIFANIYMDDIQGQDTRMWIPDESHYGLQIKDKIYYPIEMEGLKQLRIQELEETDNYNDDSKIQYYSTFRQHEYGHPETAGETYEQYTYLKGGKSNAIDGYMIFEVPKEAQLEDMIVNVNYYSFGSSQWRLSTPEELIG